MRPECKHKCRFILITPDLYLCPHAAYGKATSRKGAVEEARQLLERQGGYFEVLDRVEAEEERRRQEAAEKRAHQHEALSKSLKYQ